VVLLDNGKLVGYGKPTDMISKYKEIMNRSVSKIDSEIVEKISNYYRQVLEREPDQAGLYNFIQKIKSGELELSEIPNVMKTSGEYLKKHKFE